MRILIADDDPVVQFLLGSMLGALGHETTAASSGAACLQTLRGGDIPDVIFLDMMLGDMSGSEVMKTIRQELPAPPKIVMVSANPSAETRDLPEQPDFYLEKPFTSAGVAEALEALG